MRPVTHVAEVAVNSASEKEVDRPSFVEKGRTKRTAPKKMMPIYTSASSRTGVKRIFRCI